MAAIGMAAHIDYQTYSVLAQQKHKAICAVITVADGVDRALVPF
jgi:hypothetical protein